MCVLFNDSLNTFYLRLYGVRDMVMNHSDRERGNPLPPHRLLVSISSMGSFIFIIPDRITHTMAFVTPIMGHWLKREIAHWVHPMKDRSDDPSHHERSLLPQIYISFPCLIGCYHKNYISLFNNSLDTLKKKKIISTLEIFYEKNTQ